MAGIQLNLVHYKGGGPAVTELLGGHVEAMIVSASLVLAHAKAGRLTALGVSSKNRSAVAPGVPPIAESLPGFEAQAWVAMFAPAATPRDIVRRLNAEVGKALAAPRSGSACCSSASRAPPAVRKTWKMGARRDRQVDQGDPGAGDHGGVSVSENTCTCPRFSCANLRQFGIADRWKCTICQAGPRFATRKVTRPLLL